MDQSEQEELINVTWEVAHRIFVACARQSSSWLSDERAMKIWISLFSDLIHRGVDIYGGHGSSSPEGNRYNFPKRSVLYLYLCGIDCHLQVEAALSRWLRILLASGVDVEEYLRTEIPRCEEMWNWYPSRLHGRPGGWGRELREKNIEEFQVLVWRRWVNPASEAYDVCHEFRNFGPLFTKDHLPSMRSLHNLGRRTQSQHVSWKTVDLEQSTDNNLVENNWPYVYSAVRDISRDGLTNLYHNMGRYLEQQNQAKIFESFDYARELMQKRFKRRQLRKLYKSGYLKRERLTPKIPGAWKDPEW